MYKSKVVNTKRERRSSNNKKHSESTSSYNTVAALVTGLTSSPTMSDEMNPSETLIISPTSIEINSQPNGNHHSSEPSVSSFNPIDQSVDSGLSSEKTTVDEESTTRTHQRETSPNGNDGSGVIIPEEKRVTDRVKVFEAVANNTDKPMTKNGNKKKSALSSSFSIGDEKQVSPSSTESFDTQSITEVKTSKNKSKKSSLKKQIQNLLKIDKTPNQEELLAVEEQLNGKKNKKDLQSALKQMNPIEPLEIEIPPTNNTVSKLVNSFETNDLESPSKTPSAQIENSD